MTKPSRRPPLDLKPITKELGEALAPVKEALGNSVNRKVHTRVKDRVDRELNPLDSLRDLIREEIKAMLPAAHFADIARDAPPERPRKKKGRGYASGEKVTMPGCRVDRVIRDLFEEFRRSEALSASGAMERLLWQALGKPKLSYQEEISDE